MGQGQQGIHHHDLLFHFRRILDLWFKLLIRICKVDCRFIKLLQVGFYKPNRICCRLIWFQWPYNMAMMHLHIVNWVGSFVDVVELSIGVIFWIVPTIFDSYVATNRSSHCWFPSTSSFELHSYSPFSLSLVGAMYISKGQCYVPLP